MIKLQDFAKQQGVTDRAIQKHLKTYAEELEGLYQRKGPNGTWLTDEACEILRSKMKHAPPAIFEADPRVKELEVANADLQKQLNDANLNFQKYAANTAAALAEATKQLQLAERASSLEAENNDLKDKNAVLSAENERIDKETKKAIAEAQELSDELSGVKEDYNQLKDRNEITETNLKSVQDRLKKIEGTWWYKLFGGKK